MKVLAGLVLAVSMGIFLSLSPGCDSPESVQEAVDVSGGPADAGQSGSDVNPTMGESGESDPLSESKANWKLAKPNLELSGKITIDGSSTVYPITEAVSAAFKKLYPNVSVSVGKSGTGGGFKRFNIGESDISDASRPIKESEYRACRDNQIAFVEIPVAYDGLTVVVHKDNDFVSQLTIKDLKKIFLADGTAKSWNQVNPSYPDREIKVYAPGTDSGTFDYFKEVVAGKKGAIRNDMSTSENDDVLVNGVAGDPYAIGFFGAAYYFQNRDKLRAVPIVNPETGIAVLPGNDTIEGGSYAPFSRPLFIYVNQDAINSPQVEQFVDFYIATADKFSRDVGYVALPKAVYRQAYENFLDENVGTHYLVGEFEKRHGSVSDVYVPENIFKQEN